MDQGLGRSIIAELRRRDQRARPTSGRAPRGRILTASEEVALAKRIECGDLAAKDRMIESNLRLVFSVARGFQGRGVPLADLVQEGTVGLVRAVERFDHRRGLKFSTYAVWWIRRSILDALADAQVIRIPAKAGQQMAAVRNAESELGRRGPGQATDSAIAELTGLSETVVRCLRGAAHVTASLDAPVLEERTVLGDLVVDETALDPQSYAIQREELREIAAMLRLLPERHREVLLRRYGIGDRREQSHDEIGRWLGVGEERSRQLEREALHRLRPVATASVRTA